MKEKIALFLKSNIGDVSFNEDEDIFERGLVNSLFALQLIMFLESEFGIKIQNEDLDLKNFNSIGHMVEFVRRKKELVLHG